MKPEPRSSRDRLTRLLVACPHRPVVEPNPVDCPLYEQRTRSLAEKLAWARTVAGEVVERVLCYHDLCQAKRRILDLEGCELVGPGTTDRPAPPGP